MHCKVVKITVMSIIKEVNYNKSEQVLILALLHLACEAYDSTAKVSYMLKALLFKDLLYLEASATCVAVDY